MLKWFVWFYNAFHVKRRYAACCHLLYNYAVGVKVYRIPYAFVFLQVFNGFKAFS